MHSTRKRIVLIASCGAIAAIGLTTAAYAASGGGNGAVAGASARAAAVTTSNCTTSKTDFVSSDGSGSTSLTTFTTLLSKTVRIGGTAPSCLVVTESASAYAPATSGDVEMWAATVDGTFCSPNKVQAASNDGTYATQHTAQFICPGVSAGNHVVSFQFSSAFGTTVYVLFPTMRVEHK